MKACRGLRTSYRRVRRVLDYPGDLTDDPELRRACARARRLLGRIVSIRNLTLNLKR